ncbi:glutaredoxin family protein [Alicyclobacillus tolerans]|uniref:glutaredoxin family protein n=1 Tax=Alicyclobacillus tolerans TaxID=90970 RepID=UPI001F3963E4|nr:glutaredoxin family protein [Alicyclobacillus tolerans]MCF8567104.1 glutaredoxin family protein [Alicyclobacillus tolerans]
MAKEFLSRRGIPFREVQVFREQGAIDDLIRLTGALAAPVVIVGKRFIRGYDPYALTALLEDDGWLESHSSDTKTDMKADKPSS